MTTNDPNVVNVDNGVYDDGMTLNARCESWLLTGTSSAAASAAASNASYHSINASATWEQTMSWCPCSKWPCACDGCGCYVEGCDEAWRRAQAGAGARYEPAIGMLWGIFALLITCFGLLVIWLKSQQRTEARREAYLRSIVDMTPKDEKFKELYRDMAPPEGTYVVHSPGRGAAHIAIAVREEHSAEK